MAARWMNKPEQTRINAQFKPAKMPLLRAGGVNTGRAIAFMGLGFAHYFCNPLTLDFMACDTDTVTFYPCWNTTQAVS